MEETEYFRRKKFVYKAYIYQYDKERAWFPARMNKQQQHQVLAF